jgi:hypothetical protein
LPWKEPGGDPIKFNLSRRQSFPRRWQAPFAFNGTIKKVVFDIRHPNDRGTHAALHQAHHAGTQARHVES